MTHLRGGHPGLTYDGPHEDCPAHGREQCYSWKRGRACLLCNHNQCESCGDCSPEVPE